MSSPSDPVPQSQSQGQIRWRRTRPRPLSRRLQRWFDDWRAHLLSRLSVRRERPDVPAWRVAALILLLFAAFAVLGMLTLADHAPVAE